MPALPGPCMQQRDVYMDLRKGSVFRADETSDLLTWEDMVKYKDEEHAATKLEVVADERQTRMVPVVLTEAALANIRLAILAGGSRARQHRKRDDRVIVDVPGVRYR